MKPVKDKPNKAERILEAAKRVLDAEGAGGTTIARVAAEAGVSRGLLHYYFESKEDMLAQMLQRTTEESWEIVRSIMADSQTPEDFADNLTQAMRDFAKNEPGSMNLLAELLAVSRTSPRIRQEFQVLHRRGQEIWSEEFKAWEKAGIANVGIPFSGLSTILIALLDGLGLELQVIPDLQKEEETWIAFRQILLKLVS
jgi:AcrR family transcriptional regulator